MPSRHNQQVPSIGATAHVADTDVVGPDPTDPVADFIQAQQAVGAPLGEAIGMTAALHGDATVSSLLDAELDRLPSSPARLALLDGVALGSTALANAKLNELLRGGRLPAWESKWKRLGVHLDGRPWITVLPEGLKLIGDLYLVDCTSLERLPDDLRVDGCLYLQNCRSLKHLPDGLKVGGSLWMNECTSLVHLPVNLRVASDLHLRGCTAL